MNKFMKKKKVLLGVILMALVVVIAFELTVQSAIAVETIAIEEREFTDTFREDGTIVSELQRPIHSEVDGIVEAVHHENGDRILVGDILIEVNSDQLKYSLEALKGQLLSVEGQLDSQYELVELPEIETQKSAVFIAKNNYEKQVDDTLRSGTLYESGASSLTDYEASKNMLLAAEQTYNMEKSRLNTLYSKNQPNSGTIKYYEGQILNLKAEIAQLELQISKCTITAHKSGTLSDQFVEIGEAIRSMQKLGQVISPGMLKIESYVLSKESFGLTLGQKVSVLRDRNGLEDRIEGEIISLSPNAFETISALGLKEKRIKVEIEMEEQSDLNLIPGSDVDVEFVAYKADKAIVVPKSSVFQTSEGYAVWVVRDNVVDIQMVSKGYESSKDIEILSGIGTGDSVLKHYDIQEIEVGKTVKLN